ncbi:MAG: HlyD family efflux transporter periplasmic adaptor subunit [Paracoccaceae bacterium]
MTMRRILAAAALAACALLLVWVFRPDPVPVETAEITRGDLAQWVEAEGEARIREVVVLSAPITGLLHRVTLHPGDTVAAGQGVARIGPVPPTLLDARTRAMAEAGAAAAAAAVELAQSQLVQAETTLAFARTEADRARTLFSRDALSQRLLDEAILAERTAEASLASARASLAVREKEKQRADAAVNGADAGARDCCTEVLAPVAGSVLRVLTEDEQVIPASTPIMEIGDLGDMEIIVHVLSQDAVDIATGSGAVITGWGGPDLAAQVIRIDPSATTRISALGIEEQRVEVRLALNAAPPPTLGHGFRARARITLRTATDVLRVPVGALFRIGGDWAVYAVNDGKAKLTRLTIGLRNDDHAEVMDGVPEGALVILHPADSVTDGTAVAP